MKRDDEMTRLEAATFLGVAKVTIIYHEGKKHLTPRFDEDTGQWFHARASVEALGKRLRARDRHRGSAVGRTAANDAVELEIFRRLERGEDGVAIVLDLGLGPRRVAEARALFETMRKASGDANSSIDERSLDPEAEPASRASDEPVALAAPCDEHDDDFPLLDPAVPLLYHMLGAWPRGYQVTQHGLAQRVAGRLSSEDLASMLDQITAAAPSRLAAARMPDDAAEKVAHPEPPRTNDPEDAPGKGGE